MSDTLEVRFVQLKAAVHEQLRQRRVEAVPRYEPLLGLCPLQRLRAMVFALAHE